MQLSQKAGVLVEGVDRRIISINQPLFELLQIEGEPESYIGADCAQAARQLKYRFRKPEHFEQRLHLIVDNREPVEEEEIELVDGTVLLRDHHPLFDQYGTLWGHFWMYRKVDANAVNPGQVHDEIRRITGLIEVVSAAAQQEEGSPDLSEGIGFLCDHIKESLQSIKSFL